jgi:hypothetical protein
MYEPILARLDSEDDADLWRRVIATILGDVVQADDYVITIGRCSHWLRPHQTRWTADGGFAWPTGYSGSAYSRYGRPEYDWSIDLKCNSDRCELAPTNAATPLVYVTIPSRTTRHMQAAVHTRWTKSHAAIRFYGFRKKPDGWRLTAVSDPTAEPDREKRLRREIAKQRVLSRRQSRTRAQVE